MRMVLPIFLLSFALFQSVACWADNNCIAFNSDQLMARRRADRFFSQRVGKPMTEEVARAAMESKSIITIGSVQNTSDADTGRITMVDSRGFTLTAREGAQITWPYHSAIVYFENESPELRERRLYGLKRVELPETQKLIEDVEWAFRDGSVVEVRLPKIPGSRSYDEVYVGHIRTVDLRENLREENNVFLKFQDQISFWLELPTLVRDRPLPVGEDHRARNAEQCLACPNFELTGPGAIKPDQFRVLRKSSAKNLNELNTHIE